MQSFDNWEQRPFDTMVDNVPKQNIPYPSVTVCPAGRMIPISSAPPSPPPTPTFLTYLHFTNGSKLGFYTKCLTAILPEALSPLKSEILAVDVNK